MKSLRDLMYPLRLLYDAALPLEHPLHMRPGVPVLGLRNLYLGFSLPQLPRRSNSLPNYYLRACIRQRKRLKSPRLPRIRIFQSNFIIRNHMHNRHLDDTGRLKPPGTNIVVSILPYLYVYERPTTP